MGTNYYVRRNICKCCGRGDSDVHLGKSSLGWKFSFRSNPELGINNHKDWISFVIDNDGSIRDEYNKEISAIELLKNVFQKELEPNGEGFSIMNPWEFS